MMTKTILTGVLLVAAAISAGADEYWIAYEANDFPENVGWVRTYGDGNNPAKSEPDRRLDNGLLVVDTSRDSQLWEYYSFRRPIDPHPGELFIAEWRVRVDLLSGIHDGGVLIARDEPPGYVGFKLRADSLVISGEGTRIPITPGELHTYRLESSDMVDYRLFIDSELVHTSQFRLDTSTQSAVFFGPSTQGARSVSYWDYVRFGVVPEPSGLLLLSLGTLLLMKSRRT